MCWTVGISGVMGAGGGDGGGDGGCPPDTSPACDDAVWQATAAPKADSNTLESTGQIRVTRPAESVTDER